MINETGEGRPKLQIPTDVTGCNRFIGCCSQAETGFRQDPLAVLRDSQRKTS